MPRHIDDLCEAALYWLAWFRVRNVAASLVRCCCQTHDIVFEMRCLPQEPEVLYTYAFHGLPAHGLRGALAFGLTASSTEGGRHASHGPGVYSSCSRDTASWYAVPTNVFDNGQLWQVSLRLRLRKESTRTVPGRWGPENITGRAEHVTITHVIVRPCRLPSDNGRNQCTTGMLKWRSWLEA